MSARKAAARAEANAFIGFAQRSGEEMRNGATERNRRFAPGAWDSRRRSRADGFRRGDEACSHRERCPDGDSDCASRFCLDPTHSLLLGVRLGRNLITLFSTVNTLREKKSAAMHAAGERDRIGAHREDATRARRIRAKKPRRKKKIAFFKTFRSREKRNGAARGDEGDVRERRARRRDRRVNRSDTKTLRAVRIRRRACPIARICANFQSRFGARRRVAKRTRCMRRRHRRRHRCARCACRESAVRAMEVRLSSRLRARVDRRSRSCGGDAAVAAAPSAERHSLDLEASRALLAACVRRKKTAPVARRGVRSLGARRARIGRPRCAHTAQCSSSSSNSA